MITMDEKYSIKRLYEEDLSISEIARKVHRNWRTVKKAVTAACDAPCPITRNRAKLTDDYHDVITDWLKSDSRLYSHKDRATVRRIYDRLVHQEGTDLPAFTGSLRSVYRCVSKIRRQLKQHKPHCLNLTHPAGEAQLDFGELHVIWNGRPCAVYHMMLTFPHSNARWGWILPAQNFECVAYGMSKLFEQIGGVPTSIRFDNMSSAVAKVIAKGDPIPADKDVDDLLDHPRVVTDSFRRLQTHYCFKAEFCNAASGREKGSVENAVGWFRNNLMTPTREINGSLDDFNETTVIPFCIEAMKDRHYRSERSISDLYQEDRDAMLPLCPERFQGYAWTKATVNNTNQVVVDSNRYQVDAQATEKVWIRKTAYEIEILNDQRDVVGRYSRSYDTQKDFADWPLMVKDLIAKPTAFRHSVLGQIMSDESRGYMTSLSASDRKTVLVAIHRQLANHRLVEVLKQLETVVIANRTAKASDIACALGAHCEKRTDDTPGMEVHESWRLGLPPVKATLFEGAANA